MKSPQTLKSNIQWIHCNDIDKIDSYHSIWEESYSQITEPFFSSYNWIKHWKNTFWSHNDSFHLYIAFDNDECVLFAPFYITKENTFPYLKTLSLLGQGEKEEYEVSSEYQDIFVNQGHQYLLVELAKKLDLLSFDKVNFKYLLENSFLLTLISSYNRATTNTTGIRYLYSSNISSSPVLSKNNKSKLKKSTNKLKALDAEYEWIDQKDFNTYWELMKKLHQGRWQKVGKPGAFNHSKFAKFHNAYRKENPKHIKISAITINNKPIAINYYFSFHNTLFFYQSGWDDLNYSNISPGFALHIWSMNNSSESNYDLMKGDTRNSYKRKLGCNINNKMYDATYIKSKHKYTISKIINKILRLKESLKAIYLQ